MAIAMPKMEMPKIERKTALIGVGVLVALAAAGWYGWTTFMEEPPPAPPSKPVAAKRAPAKAPASAVAAAPAPAPAATVAAPSPALVPAPAAAPAPEARPAAVKMAAAPPAPKPVEARRRSRAHEDARACLDLATEVQVVRCAEKYR